MAGFIICGTVGAIVMPISMLAARELRQEGKLGRNVDSGFAIFGILLGGTMFSYGWVLAILTAGGVA